MTKFEEIDYYLREYDPLYYQYKNTGQIVLAPWGNTDFNTLREQWIYQHPTLPIEKVVQHFLTKTQTKSIEISLLACVYTLNPERLDEFLIALQKENPHIYPQKGWLDLLISNPHTLRYEQSKKSTHDFKIWLKERTTPQNIKHWLELGNYINDIFPLQSAFSEILPFVLQTKEQKRNFFIELTNFFGKLIQQPQALTPTQIKNADIIAHAFFEYTPYNEYINVATNKVVPVIPNLRSRVYLDKECIINILLNVHALRSNFWKYPNDFSKLKHREIWMIPQVLDNDFENIKDIWLQEMHTRTWEETWTHLDGTTVVTQPLLKMLQQDRSFWLHMLKNFKKDSMSLQRFELRSKFIDSAFQEANTLAQHKHLEEIIKHIDNTFDPSILYSIFPDFEHNPTLHIDSIYQMLSANLKPTLDLDNHIHGTIENF